MINVHHDFLLCWVICNNLEIEIMHYDILIIKIVHLWSLVHAGNPLVDGEGGAGIDFHDLQIVSRIQMFFLVQI